MKNIKIALVVLSLAIGGHASAQILSESFTGTLPASLVPMTGNPAAISNTYDGTKALFLDNTVLYQPLGTTLTSSFSISWDVAMGSYSRIEGLGLFNTAPGGPTATQGYTINWNSGLSTVNNGFGVMTVAKLNVAANDTNANDYRGTAADATTLLTYNPTGTDGTELPVTPSTSTGPRYETQMGLTWDASTDLLSLTINGNVVASVTDATYSSFSDVAIVGNNLGLVNNLVVDVGAVPEPSTFALLGFAGFAVLVWNQRRFVALRWGQPIKPSV